MEFHKKTRQFFHSTDSFNLQSNWHHFSVFYYLHWRFLNCDVQIRVGNSNMEWKKTRAIATLNQFVSIIIELIILAQSKVLFLWAFFLRNYLYDVKMEMMKFFLYNQLFAIQMMRCEAIEKKNNSNQTRVRVDLFSW